MDQKTLLIKMHEHIDFREKDVIEQKIDICDMTLINLRDCLIGLGTILDEDYDLKSYVIKVSAGLANCNTAIVAIQLFENTLWLLGYAKEGLINQHTAEKAMDKVKKRVFQYIK